jgi:hypothetical protein
MSDVGKIIEEATASTGDQDDQGNLAPENTDADDVQEQDAVSDPIDDVLKDLGEADNENDGEGSEGDEANEDDPEEGETAPKTKKGGKNSVSARIKHYSDRAKQAELEAARAKGELDAIKSIQNNQQPKDTPKEADLPEPDPEAFETETEYQNARIDHAVKKAEKRILDNINQGKATETQAQAANVATEKRNAKIKAKGDEFAKNHPDFWETVKSVGDGVSSGDGYSLTTLDYIEESDKGADIAYVLAKSPSFNRKVLGMSPIQQIRELSRLEDKLNGGSKRTLTPKTTPITPIKGGRRSVKTGLSGDPTDSEVINFVNSLK